MFFVLNVLSWERSPSLQALRYHNRHPRVLRRRVSPLEISSRLQSNNMYFPFWLLTCRHQRQNNLYSFSLYTVHIFLRERVLLDKKYSLYNLSMLCILSWCYWTTCFRTIWFGSGSGGVKSRDPLATNGPYHFPFLFNVIAAASNCHISV